MGFRFNVFRHSITLFLHSKIILWISIPMRNDLFPFFATFSVSSHNNTTSHLTKICECNPSYRNTQYYNWSLFTGFRKLWPSLPQREKQTRERKKQLNCFHDELHLLSDCNVMKNGTQQKNKNKKKLTQNFNRHSGVFLCQRITHTHTQTQISFLSPIFKIWQMKWFFFFYFLFFLLLYLCAPVVSVVF